jgi:HAD superfamily hydrolase (TIGR01509 family)
MPLPGLLPFLEHLSANNIPKAIATSANALNVAFTIEGINIKRYFNIVLDENSVTKGKPHPEIYLKTSKALNVDPSLCVVFEDSLSGITAARTAGMKVVGLTTTHAYDKLTDANMIKENFNNITIKTLESLFI